MKKFFISFFMLIAVVIGAPTGLLILEALVTFTFDIIPLLIIPAIIAIGSFNIAQNIEKSMK